jgi:hypothetical protein
MIRISITQPANDKLFQIRMNTKRVYTLLKEMDKDSQIVRILIVYNKEAKQTTAYCDLEYPTYPSISADSLAFMDNDKTNQSFLSAELFDQTISREIEVDFEIWKINKREILPDHILLNGSHYSILTEFIYEEETEKLCDSVNSPPPPSRKMVRDHNYQRVRMYNITDGKLPDYLL